MAAVVVDSKAAECREFGAQRLASAKRRPGNGLRLACKSLSHNEIFGVSMHPLFVSSYCIGGTSSNALVRPFLTTAPKASGCLPLTDCLPTLA